MRPPRPSMWDGDPRSESEKIVVLYHGGLSSVMKKYTQNDWREGKTRILVATSAWGMGVNDSHVERVLQWRCKNLECLDTLIQRFGRCARNPEL